MLYVRTRLCGSPIILPAAGGFNLRVCFSSVTIRRMRVGVQPATTVSRVHQQHTRVNNYWVPEGPAVWGAEQEVYN